MRVNGRLPEERNLELHLERLRSSRLAGFSDGRVLGFKEVLESLKTGIEDDGASLTSLVGPEGSGKTMLLKQLTQSPGARFVDLNRFVRDEGLGLDPRGKSAQALVESLRRSFASSDEHLVLLLDDADQMLLPSGIGVVVQEALRSLPIGAVLVSSTTDLGLDTRLIPIPCARAETLQRRASREEFDGELDRYVISNDADAGFLRPALRSALYTIQNQISDFRLVRYVVEMAIAESLGSGGSVHPSFIKVLFEEDSYLRETYEAPGISINPAGHLRVHEKDKTELLCDLLLSIYESREELLDVAELEMDEMSLRIAREQGTLRETVTALCLTTSPVTVVNSLVPTRDLVAELRRRKLHRSQESKVKADRVGLLLKGLGFTYAPPLHGLKDIESELRDIVELVGSDRSSVAPRIGGTWQAVASGESVLLDLLHFWARVLFGSIETLANTVNREGGGRRPLDASRLTLGEVVRLLRRLRRSIREEGAPLVARLTESEILDDDFLRTADDFVQQRNEFVHDNAEGPKSELLEKLTVCALDLVVRAKDAGYPAVIEVAEIVFDRYGRQIFRGSDSTGRSLTFAVSDEGEAARLEVAGTYFMLPRRLVSTDPVLVPTSRTGSTVLFGEATDYARHSHTQVRQADYLFDLLPALGGDEDILDVGCGDGRITARLGLLVPNGHVTGLDISPSMVELASSSHKMARNMNWVVGTAEDLGFEQVFDVVFSNAALHWTTDPVRSFSGIHRALRPGGTFISHQGGHGTYAGLRSVAVRLIEDRGLEYLFNGWKYPTWYPTVEEIQDLLLKSGFVDVAVDSVITDGSELPTLVTDFARAGLLPFLERLPAVEVHAFTEEFIELASAPGVDLSTHRLFVSARRSHA